MKDSYCCLSITIYEMSVYALLIARLCDVLSE